jgi:hypothetical protein
VVPAIVIELGGIEGDDGVDVALGSCYRLPQVLGAPARRPFRIRGHDAVAHHGGTLVAQEFRILVEIELERVLVVQQQPGQVITERNRPGWRGLTGTQVDCEQFVCGVTGRARYVVDGLAGLREQADRLPRDSDCVGRSSGLDEVIDRCDRLIDIAGVPVGVVVVGVPAAGRHDQVHDGTPDRRRVRVHRRGP